MKRIEIVGLFTSSSVSPKNIEDATEQILNDHKQCDKLLQIDEYVNKKPRILSRIIIMNMHIVV